MWRDEDRIARTLQRPDVARPQVESKLCVPFELLRDSHDRTQRRSPAGYSAPA